MARKPINPSALTVRQLADILTKAGGRRVPQKQLRQDLDAGAPCNEDGTISLVQYTAWQAAQVK
jgi:hypothetical protein